MKKLSFFLAIFAILALFCLYGKAKRDADNWMRKVHGPTGRAKLLCIQFHRHNHNHCGWPTITLNFTHAEGGEPILWYVSPFGMVCEEEVAIGSTRWTIPTGR